MKNKNLVIVYGIGLEIDGKKPFPEKDRDLAYRKFSSLGKKFGFDVFIAHYSDYSDGKLKKAFYLDKTWKIADDVKVDVVYDKFEYDKDTMKIKGIANSKHPVVDSLEVERICKDKFALFNLFPKDVPFTVLFNSRNALKKISSEKVVIKPRFGFEGRYILVVDKKNALPKKGMIAQEFIDTSKGVKKLGIKGVHDIRMTFVDGKHIYTLIRQPKKGFIANLALGGKKRYVDAKPKELMEIAARVMELFEKHPHYVFSVDFMYDEKQKPWIVELNSKPGLVKFKGAEALQERYMKAILSSLKKAGS